MGTRMERSGAVRKWRLQLDIHNYFMSIDQDILQANTHHLCQALWRNYPFLAQYFDFDPERPLQMPRISLRFIRATRLRFRPRTPF